MGVIGTIRKHSWVAVAIVGVAIVAFIIGDLQKNRGKVPDMGKINGTTISANHFNVRMSEVEEQYKRQQGVAQIPSDLEYQLREQLWQTMVSETLLGAEYDALGLQVTDEELSDMFGGNFLHPYVRQWFTNPQTGQFDRAQINYIIEHFEDLDSTVRMQWLDMEKAVREDRQVQKYNQLIAQGFYMPKALAEQVATMSGATRTVAVVDLPYAEMPDNEVQLSDDDYKQYYNKHKKEFRVAEELRDIDMIVFNAAPTQEDLQNIESQVMEVWDTLQVTEEIEIPYLVNSESDHQYDSSYVKASDLSSVLDSLISPLSAGQYLAPRIIGNEWVMAKVMNTAVRPDSLRASTIYVFNQNAGASITRSDEEAKSLADSIAAQLRSGRLDFEAAVQEFSDDPQRVDNNGDMGWQIDGGYGFLNEDIINTPVGGVFVKRHPQEVGYFVVRVTDKTPAVKKYRLALITREIQPSEQTMRDVFSQAQNFAAGNRTLQELTATAQAHGMQVRQARLTAMSPNVNGVNNSRNIVQWAFNEKSEIGEVADQVFESENMFVVVALRDIFKQGYATEEQSRSMIEQQVRIEKKAEMLIAKAGEAAKGATSIDAVASKLGLDIDTVYSSLTGYYFGQFGMEPKMQGATAAAEMGKIFGPVQGAQGVYMASVLSQAEDSAENSEMIRANFQQMYMQKARMVPTTLRYAAKITDQRNKFF